MEQLAISIAMAVIQGIPQLIASVNASKTLDEETKKRLLFDLNVALTEANVHVQRVRFPYASESVIVPPAP